MGRDSRTKRKAEQLAQEVGTDYMPVIGTPVTGNFPQQKADGSLDDSGFAPGDFTVLQIAGDGTAGRVLRLSKLTIEDGTAANSLKCTLASLWNGDAIGATDSITKGATVGNFSLNAGGTILTVEAAGLSGNVVMATGMKVYNGGAPPLEVEVSFTGNDITVTMLNPTTATAQDMTAHVDTSAGAMTKATILYLTSA